MEDKINHPKHYNSSNASCPECKRQIQCIDVTRHMSFNLGNALKYIWRAEHKGNKKEDLQKAIWYLQDEINNIDIENTDIKNTIDYLIKHGWEKVSYRYDDNNTFYYWIHRDFLGMSNHIDALKKTKLWIEQGKYK